MHIWDLSRPPAYNAGKPASQKRSTSCTEKISVSLETSSNLRLENIVFLSFLDLGSGLSSNFFFETVHQDLLLLPKISNI